MKGVLNVVELIEQYVERFHENFPLFALMGMEESEVEAIIQDCLDTIVFPYLRNTSK